MSEYWVRYYREERSSVRMCIKVEADSPEAARALVLAAHEENYEALTAAEWETESSEKEEVLGGEFTGLEDENDPYAVVEAKP